MASNMMELMKSKFASMSKDELSLTARSANDNLAMGFMPSGNMQLMIAGNFVLQSCLRLGFCTRKLSEKQQWLMKELYRLSEETRNQQSAAAVEAITETDYQLIEKLAGSNRQISEAMFNLIMCAAYADGGLKKEVEDKIDPIFGMLFLALFADSGLESVPAPTARRPHVTGLEARVLDYLLRDKRLTPLNKIAAAFPGETKNAVKKALDGLCDKDLVHWLPNVMGEPYSADIDREDVDIILSDVKTETQEEKARREKAETERKRKEAEARAAAEKKKREEEAKRKAAEEEKKKKTEAEKKAYEKAVENWKQETRKAESARNDEIARRKKEREQILNRQCDEDYSKAKAAAQSARTQAEQKKAAAEETLATLGAFKFSEKKAQKALIAEAQAEIEKAENASNAADQAYQTVKDKISSLLNAYVSSQMPDIEKRFPLPKVPQKPVSMIEEEKKAEIQASVEKRINENKIIKEAILAVLEPNRWYRCAEIKALVPQLAEVEGTQRTARLCNDLVSEGLLQKSINDKIVYFALEEFATVHDYSLENQGTVRQTENANIKSQIIASMEEGKAYRCAEIKALVPKLAKEEGTQRTARLCNDLVSEGLLVKSIDNKVVYFALAE